MELHIVATRDIVANVYSAPQFVPALGGAIRAFGDACSNTSDPNNILGKHPKDFELFHMGTYDDTTGSFHLLPIPKQIAVGGSYAQ